jgi:predicted ATPase/DNA-binding SARP family transcriptional activator
MPAQLWKEGVVLRLSLFGTPRVERDGQDVTPGRAKAVALLSYLAVTRQPHERELLATLLWPELDAEAARNGLRRELSGLRAALGADLFRADRRHVLCSPEAVLWLDVAHFGAQIARTADHGHRDGELCSGCADALRDAVELYSDDFLVGLLIPGCAAFEEWQFFQREALRDQLALALRRLGDWHRRRGEHEPAIALARRWLQLDPLHEPAHRALMELYALAGRHSAALRQYQECVRLLDAELGSPPDAETVALAEAIQRRRVAPRSGDTPPTPAAASAPDEPGAPPAHRPLPPPASPLLGREQELANLRGYLESPNARLITLVGPGGIGKTRLAIELAAQAAPAYPDGVAFVNLQPIVAPEQLVATIADAVGCRLSGTAPPQVQLLSHLRDQELLLVLDNFEHLLAGASLVSDLLLAAPRVRLLVTSREVLNLQEEWSYPLGGLTVPPEAAVSVPLEQYTAVRLFAERAKRARPGFSLHDEPEAASAICRLVEGMPLALELAAAWASAMTCGQIAAEIARGLAFLVARQRNLPDRHRSMEAVFDSSWQLLDPAAQALLAGLAIFRGGFSADAALRVTGASLPLLATLTDKSLVRLDFDGRYQIHEQIRQYAEHQLAARPAEAAQVRQAHSDYYCAFLVERDEAVSHGRDVVRTAEIAAELENVRLAWRHAVDSGGAERLGRAINTLANFYLYRGPVEEGIALLEPVIQSLRQAAPSEGRDRLLAEVLHEQAWLHLNCGQFAAGRAGLEETQQLYARLGIQATVTGRASDPRAGLSLLALLEGSYAEAARLAEAYLQLSMADAYRAQRPFAWYLVAHTALAQGLYGRARHAAEQAYAAVQAEQDRWFEAYVLIDLGRAAQGEGRHPEARRHFQASYAIREAFGDPEGKALALFYEGMVALREGVPAEADGLFARSLAIYRTRGDVRGLAEAHMGQGMAHVALGQLVAAADHFRSALALAREVKLLPLTLAILVSAGELLITAGRPREARAALMIALRHPAAERETSDQAAHLLISNEGAFAPDSAAAQVREPTAADVDTVVAQLLVVLVAWEPIPATSTTI